MRAGLRRSEPLHHEPPITRSTDCYRKGPDGLRVLHPLARGESVRLARVVLELSAAQLFADVLEV